MSVPISLVFATADRPCLVRRTLASLCHAEKPRDFQGIWVIENGSRAGTEEVVREFTDRLPVHYFFSSLANKPAAINLGISQVPDSLVYLTDDDVRFYPGTLVALAQAAAIAPRESFFGGPFDIDYEQSPPEWLHPWLPFSARGWQQPHREPLHVRRGRFLGFNWAVYRHHLEALEGFDPDIGPGTAANGTGDETVMQNRLRQQNIQPWYVPEMRLAHYVPQDRCSPEWAVDRAYRHGIGWGQMHQASSLRPLLRVKAYSQWQLARGSLALQKTFSSSTTPTVAHIRESKWRGRVEGLRRPAA